MIVSNMQALAFFQGIFFKYKNAYKDKQKSD